VSKAIDKRRDDTSPALEVTRWLNAQVKRAGVRYAAILEHFGFNEGSGQIGHWTALSIGAQPAVPTWPQWLELKALLGFGDEMDTEVWRLNGRKGHPGEAWHEREITGEYEEWRDRVNYAMSSTDGLRRDIPATPEAAQWAGWGTALKPAWEPVIVARKPLVGTVAANVLAHGTGAINVAATCIGTFERGEMVTPERKGRWPANVVLDETAAELLDAQTGVSKSPSGPVRQ
jgi:hypothetical protein